MVKDDAIVCAPSPFIATDDWFLLGVLNSKAADWYVHQVGVTRSGGYMEYKPVFCGADTNSAERAGEGANSSCLAGSSNTELSR